MNKMNLRLLVMVFFIICLPACSLSERSVTESMAMENVTDTWGHPIRYGNTVCIYHHGDQFLIAAFDNTNSTISDYVIINTERMYIEGTIDRSFTIDSVLYNLFHDMSEMVNLSYDNGSGTTIHTLITSDGYVVEWTTEAAYSFWFLLGGDCRIIDSIFERHSSFAYQTPIEFYAKHLMAY